MAELSKKLKYARDRVGLTLAQVHERTEIGKSSLSEFENGKREPKFIQLQKLADLYRRSLEFFLGDQPIPQEVVLWRERPVEGTQELEMEFLRLCRQYHNLEVWCDDQVDSWLPEPSVTRSRFGYPQAEALAKSVRDQLQLGDRPGQELLRVLEEVCGVKIFYLSFQPTGTAASTNSPSYGRAILLNRNNIRWRRNFDLAHELFHLLTWKIFRSNVDTTSCVAADDEEKLATCFAGHLLMPHDALHTRLEDEKEDGSISFETLFDVAREFDVSVESLLWRIHYLYDMGPGNAERTKKNIERAESLRGLYEEREDSPPPKWPRRYHALAVKALRHGEISLGRFAEYLGISRQKAMSYIEREIEEDEKVEIAPVRC